MNKTWRFNRPDLAFMQHVQETHMMDICTIDRYADAGADAFGNPDPNWPTGTRSVCGFMPSSSDEGTENSNVPLADAIIRLPIDAEIDSKDRITITHRHGIPITNETYELIGEPRRGPSGLVCDVKVVTDGS